MLRKRGLSPAPVGSGARDSAKLAAFNAVRGINHTLQRLRGHQAENLAVPYAPVP